MIKDVIGRLDHEELHKLKKDLENGGVSTLKLVHEKIQENERKHEKYCTTCSSDIDPNSTNNYTLVFGPDNFKKKASFCAIDCLNYFLRNLKEVENKVEKDQFV